jgi:catechol 2,3-dioxygenase-like lactoylglutathione lyase family enzyme
VDHLGLCVRDLHASLAFYTEVAGFTVRMAPRRIAGAWFDTLTRNEGAEIEVAMVELGPFTLQLVQYHAAGSSPVPSGHDHPGNPHLSISVVDVDAKHAEVVAAGRHHPTAIVEITGTGARSFYAEDPDGTPVEFIAMPS